MIPCGVVGFLFGWFLKQGHTTLCPWPFPFCEHGDLLCPEPFQETISFRKQKPLFFSCSLGFLLMMFFNYLFYSVLLFCFFFFLRII